MWHLMVDETEYYQDHYFAGRDFKVVTSREERYAVRFASKEWADKVVKHLAEHATGRTFKLVEIK